MPTETMPCGQVNVLMVCIQEDELGCQDDSEPLCIQAWVMEYMRSETKKIECASKVTHIRASFQ